MPLAGFVPSELEYDYPRWTAPVIGSTDTGKAWAWNHATGKYEPTTFLLASAVSVYGLTLASAADASAARSALSLGTAAVLNVGTSANNIVQLDGSARLPAVDGSQLTGISGGSGSPGGSTTQVQYNNAGAFAGDAGMTYDTSTDRLTVAGGLVAPGMRPASDDTTALQLQNAAGTAVVTVDTTNNALYLGTVIGERFEVSGPGRQYIRITATNAAEAGLNYQNSIASVYTGIPGAANQIVVGSVAGDFIFNNRGGAIVFSADSGYTRKDIAIATTGYVGFGTRAPTAAADFPASTTTRASLRVRAGTAPTTPNAGDIWFDGTHFYGYNGSATVQLDN